MEGIDIRPAQDLYRLCRCTSQALSIFDWWNGETWINISNHAATWSDRKDALKALLEIMDEDLDYPDRADYLYQIEVGRIQTIIRWPGEDD